LCFDNLGKRLREPQTGLPDKRQACLRLCFFSRMDGTMNEKIRIGRAFLLRLQPQR
jgi:hypothetical protein